MKIQKAEEKLELPQVPDAPAPPPAQLSLLGAPEPLKPADPMLSPRVVEVLEHWRSRGYHTRIPRDLPARRKRIVDRLAEDFDVSTLKAAIDGASLDDWLMGRTDRSTKRYTDLDTILRDAVQVERLATIWDVAIAEGEAMPDGGTKRFDRYGNVRPLNLPENPTAKLAREQRERVAASPAPAGPEPRLDPAQFDYNLDKFMDAVEERRTRPEREERARLAAERAEAFKNAEPELLEVHYRVMARRAALQAQGARS